MPRPLFQRPSPHLAGLLAALAGIAVAGCTGIERTPPPPRQVRAEMASQIDVPTIMRGTIASEAIVEGFQPVVVHGYGVVVGLDGTGSSDVPPDVRAHMIAMAARHGIGSEQAGWGDLSPEALLDSPDTAVVVVEGVIPPAAPEGSRFDVRVFAHPTSATTSLEGGRLYTTELLPAAAGASVGQRTLPPTGSRTPAALAEAKGALFINPFAEPGAVGRDTIDRRTGWILNGGHVDRDIPMKLRLITPSHGRAMAIQSALNTRFVQEPGQSDPTGRGESDELIVITVPPSYRDDTETFVELVRYTTIRQDAAERVAMSTRRYVLDNPAMSSAAGWRWEALGPRALPVTRDLYDEPQELPRLAALRAGARLDDPLVTPHLIAMAESGSAESRRRAIKLLTGMGIDPRIDMALQELLNDDDLEVRLAAYETLVERAGPAVQRFVVENKFIVDVVESKRPMIYITQAGMPRLAIFGSQLSVKTPLTVTAWSQRFMMKGDVEDKQVEVYYRPPDTTLGVTHLVDGRIPELVEFLGRTTTPDKPLPGLGFSYSEVVGVLHQIWRQGYLEADFRPEQDRILAAILRQQRRGMVTERPEFSEAGLDRPDSPAAGELRSPPVGPPEPVPARGSPGS
ncbi:MAG: flagellar basal body P-ring protein FlgI [Planctomycetota bacterium]